MSSWKICMMLESVELALLAASGTTGSLSNIRGGAPLPSFFLLFSHSLVRLWSWCCREWAPCWPWTQAEWENVRTVHWVRRGKGSWWQLSVWFSMPELGRAVLAAAAIPRGNLVAQGRSWSSSYHSPSCSSSPSSSSIVSFTSNIFSFVPIFPSHRYLFFLSNNKGSPEQISALILGTKALNFLSYWNALHQVSQGDIHCFISVTV